MLGRPTINKKWFKRVCKIEGIREKKAHGELNTRGEEEFQKEQKSKTGEEVRNRHKPGH